jgi:SAM-dependent methyltransferase
MGADGGFEELYAAAADGTAEIPWDRAEPSAMLVAAALPSGGGQRALVVGCGLGRDAEYVAALGYATTAFDLAPTAIRLARQRHPGSAVDYRVADVFAPPAEWERAFDLVVEANTIQSLPPGRRAPAIARVAGFVASGGMLVVLAAKETLIGGDGPPWPLTRAEIESFGRAGLHTATIEEIPAPDDPLHVRGRATFTR